MPPNLRAGVAQGTITPPPGLDLTGYIARQNPATGVRDPLYARSLVLDDGRRQIALVSCDLLSVDREFVDDTRRRITLATGLPGLQVMLATTHTHAGPATFFLQGCGDPDPAYVEDLQTRIVALVRQAQSALQPATLAVGEGSSVTGVHNRRTPGDVMDPAVEVLRVDRVDGTPLAVVVNYACHPTALSADNTRVSADYPGYVCAQVEAATGAVCLFLTGAIGDVGPVARGDAVLTQIGQAVADETLRVLPGCTPLAGARLDTEGEILALPLADLPSRDQILDLRAGYQQQALGAEGRHDPLQARIARAMVGWSERILDMYRERTLQATVPAEILTLHVGELTIVGVPGELFVELGLQIKAAAPAPVMVVGFANDSIGYIPARRAYPQGGYEIDDAYKYYGYPAVLAPEAGEMIVANAARLVQSKQ
ncbi:MAG: neutral/alkaline non-lysosomal ceramidase N-terminal domain-containing protein [Caldilineaceae bacterium]|nr:neutral/alkaline non-lysosomal ceramidase N-terminal domain-containing protein [Caldilineaceae bacterium]